MSAPANATVDTPALEARSITQRFGGLLALKDASLALRVGELHALIGTNGAGKSTLVAVLAGECRPTHGEVLMKGQRISTWAAPRRARAGLGRSFQRSSLLAGHTVLEHVRLAVQAPSTRPWSMLRPAHGDALALERAWTALAELGLAHAAAQPVEALSHGERRLLELAMVRAPRPQVMLLDEPLAGLGATESEPVLEALLRWKAEHALLLIEHDMQAVFRVADRITVLVRGEVLATGSPAEVRARPDVQRAYLGEVPSPC